MKPGTKVRIVRNHETPVDVFDAGEEGMVIENDIAHPGFIAVVNLCGDIQGVYPQHLELIEGEVLSETAMLKIKLHHDVEITGKPDKYGQWYEIIWKIGQSSGSAICEASDAAQIAKQFVQLSLLPRYDDVFYMGIVSNFLPGHGA